ncbi:hypothetical protein M5D96_005333, partial [Drosophila gunungcola]
YLNIFYCIYITARQVAVFNLCEGFQKRIRGFNGSLLIKEFNLTEIICTISEDICTHFHLVARECVFVLFARFESI